MICAYEGNSSFTVLPPLRRSSKLADGLGSALLCRLISTYTW